MAACSPMPVPTYDQFIEPLLRVLAQHPDGVAVRSRSTGTGRDGRTTG